LEFQGSLCWPFIRGYQDQPESKLLELLYPNKIHAPAHRSAISGMYTAIDLGKRHPVNNEK
jgi:hypothetical protein